MISFASLRIVISLFVFLSAIHDLFYFINFAQIYSNLFSYLVFFPNVFVGLPLSVFQFAMREAVWPFVLIVPLAFFALAHLTLVYL
jgi:hypothetical protein